MISIPTTGICLGLGWALVHGYRWAYIPVLVLLLASEGWAAWFFFISGTAHRYSMAVRLVDGLLVLALGSLPLVLMLLPSARKWVTGPAQNPVAQNRQSFIDFLMTLNHLPFVFGLFSFLTGVFGIPLSIVEGCRLGCGAMFIGLLMFIWCFGFGAWLLVRYHRFHQQ